MGLLVAPIPIAVLVVHIIAVVQQTPETWLIEGRFRRHFARRCAATRPNVCLHRAVVARVEAFLSLSPATTIMVVVANVEVLCGSRPHCRLGSSSASLK